MSDGELSIRPFEGRLSTAVEEVTQKRVPYTIALRREGDPASLVADAAKLRRELGWEPKRSGLRDSVHDAWAFYQLKFTH